MNFDKLHSDLINIASRIPDWGEIIAGYPKDKLKYFVEVVLLSELRGKFSQFPSYDMAKIHLETMVGTDLALFGIDHVHLQRAYHVLRQYIHDNELW